MSILQTSDKEEELLARIMRAEAIGEGNLGMLMVGNVVANRALANCLTFKNTRTITEVVYQSPGGFSSINSPIFYSNPTTLEKDLAKRIIKGEYYYPATNALWFYAPKTDASCQNTWWDQSLSGKYKSHCFYNPAPGVCRELH